MKIKTEVLKEMVADAIQGASNNKLIPITQFIGIVADSGELKLITTDGTNYLYVTADGADDDINVTVFCEQFAKLVSKMTSKEISLDIVDGNLEVVGNGTYTLELPVDEEGEPIIYPSPYANIKEPKKCQSLDRQQIVDAIGVCEASLLPPSNNKYEDIENYYIGDKVITTNKSEVACINENVLNKGVLISPHLMNLLSIMDEDEIKYHITNDYMLFKTAHTVVFSKQSSNADDFPVDKLDTWMQTEFKSICKVDKNSFIALLERIMLFVDKYDNKAINLKFEKDGIRVFNMNKSSNELLEFVESKDYVEYECYINAETLLRQLKAYQADIVEIHYDSPVCIKLVNEDTIQMIALLIEN